MGLRYDQFSGAGFDRPRGFVVIGLQGLALYRFEVEPALFMSDDGDVSARLTATYEVLLTQQLILQPRLDFDAAVQAAEKFDVGASVNSLGLAAIGLRPNLVRRWDSGPYMRASSLNSLNFRLECAPICPRFPTVSRRFPKSGGC